tara:strand:- start:7699 stop:8022 length:324 start_codon:yes stop_codon:yes gene_type:complete
MIDEVVWTQGASADLQEQFEKLEDTADGRGLELIERVDAAMELLKAHPEIASRYGTRLRRKLIGKNCEFGLFYSIVGHRIILAALLDLRQDPKQILRTLKQRGVGDQ